MPSDSPSSPKTKSSRHLFREYDRFEIINPEIVVRVGYPLTSKIIYDELNTAPNRQRIIDMLEEFDVSPQWESFDAFMGNIPNAEIHSILYSISCHTLRVRNFGGNERRIHTTTNKELLGKRFQVEAKKVVCTGIRVPPSGPDSEGEWESGYLDQCKRHRLVGFIDEDFGTTRYHSKDFTWISEENIKFIEPPSWRN